MEKLSKMESVKSNTASGGEASAVRWTPEQEQVIRLRNRSMLVSAAAGSGKTAVLVERIISMVTDKKNPVNVDELLVVTFTNAAAAEMRGRVLAAMEEALEKDPANVHLQRQTTLIHNAQITTIDSFCNYILHNYFYKIGLEPGFRIADPGELTLLREDVCDAVLEEFYEKKDERFFRFADGYSTAKSDRPVRDMILRLFDFSQSYPWPREWLNACAAQYRAESPDELEKKPWVADFLSYLHTRITEETARYREICGLTQAPDGPWMYTEVIKDDLRQLERLLSCKSLADWQEALGEIAFLRLPAARKYEGSVRKKEAVMDARNALKKQIANCRKKYFRTDIAEQTALLNKTAEMAETLVELVHAFSERFHAEKAKRNILDFSDVEHCALDILVDPDTKKPTETAAEMRTRFHEIMIDEYQDSNYVQEELLTAVSGISEGRENLFMVGDVKQSIYRFRLARPELFMQKYDRFSTEESDRQRIDLHKNFRSRSGVVTVVNDIFSRIMGRDLGNVEYDREASLYQGASFADEDSDVFCPECILVKDDVAGEEKRKAEARAVAQRIRALMDESEWQYRDCVILLRSLSGWAEAFQTVFEEEGIPLVVSSQTGYFSAPEVQTALAMLRILDNPCQDISLAAVMRSEIGRFTDAELAQIRIAGGNVPFFACVMKQEGLSQNLQAKVRDFRNMLADFRGRVPYTPVHELLQQIYDETRFRDYVTALPAGEQRRANLDMLLQKAIAYEQTSYHGLFHFVRYIDRLMKYNVDYGEAELFGEQENAVRLMTIHKSKGLEFPVVIVAGMGKQFNMTDVRSSMIFHPKYGVGLKYHDAGKRTKTDTLLRQVFSVETKRENLGEELRILYVALTRAKEKLIMIGFYGDDEPETAANLKEYEKLPFSQRMNALCYLDWALPALKSYGGRYQIVRCGFENRLEREVGKQELLRMQKDFLARELATVDDEVYRRVDARLSWKYPFVESGILKQKVSVSEIKHRAMEDLDDGFGETAEQKLFPQEIPNPYVPKFVQEQEENRGALRGTAMHRFMESLDFASLPLADIKDRNLARRTLAEISEKILAEKRMEKTDMGLVNFRQVSQFLQTDAAGRMCVAAKNGRLRKEQPFVMSLAANRVWGIASEEPVLVQGIIDVFWEEADGFVLLDYKTDRVDTAEELIRRYRAQLFLYAEAVERMFAPKKVKGIFIYSFRLDRLIEIHDDENP